MQEGHTAVTKGTLVALALVVGMTVSLRGQSGTFAPAPPTFEVASVKATAVGCPPACGLIRSTPGSAGYHAEGATLHSLMTVAYSITDRQISSSPRWMETERFDIEAKT